MQKDSLDALITKFETLIRSALPEAKVNLYGSYATGLSMPWSDIDMVMEIVGDDSATHHEILPIIEKSLTDSEGLVQEIKYIKNASIPILKIICSDEYFNKKIDIT